MLRFIVFASVNSHVLACFREPLEIRVSGRARGKIILHIFFFFLIVTVGVEPINVSLVNLGHLLSSVFVIWTAEHKPFRFPYQLCDLPPDVSILTVSCMLIYRFYVYT